jgi:hypothetical protein
MQESNSPRRFSAVPLGHKLIAVVIAVAVAGSLHAWFNRNAAHSASAADLSFDPAAAHRIDPGLADTSAPAVAIAQSILTDQVIAGLSRPTYLSTSTMTSRIGEFRARLELTQPSAQMLRVQFHDADPAKSAATANAIAKTLAAWSHSSLAAPPPAAPPQPAPAPASKPAAAHPDQPIRSLSASLGDLEAQLSSTSRELDRLSSPTRRTKTWRGQHAHEPPSYTQAKQQQLLKTRVKAAQQQLDDLRVQFANESPRTGIKDQLAAIQQELSSILPARNASKHHAGASSFNAAGTNASELRQERAQLSRVISVVERDRRAIQREEPARPESRSESKSESRSESRSGSESASGSGSEPISESDLGSGSGSRSMPPAVAASHPPAPPQQQPAPPPSAAALSQNPLRLARMAGASAHTSWWPPVLVGLLCGLLYLAFTARAAALAYHPLEYEESDTEEIPQSAYRFITPNQPAIAPAPEPRPESRPAANTVPDDPFEPPPYKRASFTFEPPSPETLPPETTPSVHEPDVNEPTINEPSAIEEARPSDNAEAPVIAGDRAAPFSENLIGIADGWVDDLRKTLSQTEIGRRFEDAPAQEDATTTSQNQDDPQQRPAPPDRLAG